MCIPFHIFPRMIYFYLLIYLFIFIASETQRRKKLHGIDWEKKITWNK